MGGTTRCGQGSFSTRDKFHGSRRLVGGRSAAIFHMLQQIAQLESSRIGGNNFRLGDNGRLLSGRPVPRNEERKAMLPSVNRRRRLSAEALEDRLMMTVPDFSLIDVNTTSPTYMQAVSPRQFMGQVSGWYFGHST